MYSVSFASEQTDFSISNTKPLEKWLNTVCNSEGKTLTELAFIFCSDDYLLGVNKQFLAHDYYTDVITFDYSEDNHVSGDIFISIDRVRDNAFKLSETEENELHRIMVHGLLHLIGYSDKTSTEKSVMTQKEDFYLSSRSLN